MPLISILTTRELSFVRVSPEKKKQKKKTKKKHEIISHTNNKIFLKGKIIQPLFLLQTM
jgi:hypothetical protein